LYWCVRRQPGGHTQLRLHERFNAAASALANCGEKRLGTIETLPIYSRCSKCGRPRSGSWSTPPTSRIVKKMARKKRVFEWPAVPVAGMLVERLAAELKSNRQFGQPLVDEQEFSGGRIRVTVIWDEWVRLPLEDRSAIILRAYDEAEGDGYRDKIVLASGLTVPEAHAAGILPFQIIAAVRSSDLVTLEQCNQAMIAEGASILGGGEPQLLFATLDDAEAARKRLAEQLPNSEPVWIVRQDVGSVEDWIST
jgi:hypothetical protein